MTTLYILLAVLVGAAVGFAGGLYLLGSMKFSPFK